MLSLKMSFSHKIDLNRSLNEFYERHAKKETVDGWLESHPFPEALPDEADEKWKAQ